MKRIMIPLLVMVCGAGVGSAAAFATVLAVGSPPAAQAAEAATSSTSFVPTGPILAPLVLPDGRLAGYYSFEVQLEVDQDQVERVTGRLPLLLHAINLRTFRTPLASGPDGMLPNVEMFRAVVTSSTPDAFGPGIVHRVAVTQATPA